MGDFDFFILHTYPWYLQKVALNKPTCAYKLARPKETALTYYFKNANHAKTRIIQEKIVQHTITCNPVQTQESVYELSRSQRNEASFEAKAERATTKNKPNRRNKGSQTVGLGYREIGEDTDGLLFIKIKYVENTRNARASE